MSAEITQLGESIERLLAEHTRLRVENQALNLRVREMEKQAAASGERVKHARARLDKLIAQLPLDMDAQEPAPPAASQTSLL
jgi:regulator of replication initiation timing